MEKKLKVVQVLPSLESGGVERGVLETAKALSDQGHESLVISAGGRLVETLEAQGSKHISWDLGKKSLSMLFQVKAMRRWLELNQPDVIHVRSRMPAWVVWLAWRKMPAKKRPHLVSVFHGLHSVSRYSEIMGCGERVIAVSEAVKEYILTNYPRISPDRIRMAYRGVAPQDFPRDYQSEQSWLDDFYDQYPQCQGKKIITLPGRLTRLKGHLQFLPVLKQLVEKDSSIVGLIVGGEDPKRKHYAKEVYAKAKELGLSDNLVFAGHRSDIRDIYSISNLVLSLSSKPESFGRTVLEPLAMGVPVVAWNHGGVTEILRELYPQGLVTLNDTLQLLETISECLSSPAEIKENTKFLLSTMTTAEIDVYKEVVAQ